MELTDRGERLTGQDAQEWMVSASLRSAILLERVLGGLGAGEDGRTPQVVPVVQQGLVVAGRKGLLTCAFGSDLIRLCEVAVLMAPQHDPAYRVISAP
ncbi:hypothetical protein [Deinococcus navajonensis]|uniref:Uncharacterized protein n=1 Tax=Deinococcus navajonensis TaxID=309884 RepID=A0ABV8XJG7_9DEIO